MTTGVATDRTFGLRHGEITDKIIGFFYDVYNELGPGFLESVYKQSMLVACTERGMRARRQVPIPVSYHGHVVGEFYADLLVEEVVVVELKTARAIDSSHEAQLLHYLKATDKELGLILNFGSKPQIRRLILDNAQKLRRAAPEPNDPWKSVVNLVRQ